MKKNKDIDIYEGLNRKLENLQTDISRIAVGQFFNQYNGKRNIYESLGYNSNPTIIDFFERYKNQDIVKAVVDRLCNYTWRGDVSIYSIEEQDNENDSLYQWWNRKNKELSIQKKLLQADKLSLLGEYSCILLGFNDVKKNSDFERPVNSRSDLIYLTPLSQIDCKIQSYEENISSKRYGMPLMYSIILGNNLLKEPVTINVHYTRVIHIVYDALDNEIKGIPFLLPIYHRFEDLDKIVGSSAEMFWRGARPGYFIRIGDNSYVNDIELKNKLEESLNKFENDLRRFIATQGIDNIESLHQQITDPLNFFDIQLQLISLYTGIPKRILVGSERGELASTQDKETFNEVILARRKSFAEPEILNKLFNRLYEVGTLPERKYVIEWMKVYDEDINNRTDRALKITQAITAFTSNPYNEEFMPKETYMRIILGFTDDQIEEITKDLDNINNQLKTIEKEDNKNETNLD